MHARRHESDPPELPDLATFVLAAERGSFTAAAGALGVTQAAVSQRIARLERALDRPLFRRRAGRVELTEAGRTLHGYARRILGLHAEARAALGGDRPPVEGELPIGASSIPGECLLPGLLAEFHRAFPRVHVRATIGDSSSVLRDVERGQVSLGLVGQPADAPGLESRPLGGDCLALVVPPGHRWAGVPGLAAEALHDEPMILREPGSGSRRLLEEGLRALGIEPRALAVALELGSNAAIRDAVRGGLGVAFLSYLCVRGELERGELVRVAVPGLELRRSFYAVRDRRRPLSPAAGAFTHFLEAHPPPVACC